jgi:hypothetical protein
MLKLICEPSEAEQPVPVEGELRPPCALNPVHALHFPFAGIVNPCPTRMKTPEAMYFAL